MSVVHGSVAFGVRVKLQSPLGFSKETIHSVLSKAEQLLTASLSKAVNVTLIMLPGVSVTLTEAKTKIDVESVES